MSLQNRTLLTDPQDQHVPLGPHSAPTTGYGWMKVTTGQQRLYCPERYQQLLLYPTKPPMEPWLLRRYELVGNLQASWRGCSVFCCLTSKNTRVKIILFDCTIRVFLLIDWTFNLNIYKLNIKLCASVSMKPFGVILYVIKLNLIKNGSSYLFRKEAYFLFISSVLARTKHLMTIARNEFPLILLPQLLKPSCVLSLLYVFAIIFSSLPWLKTTQLVRLEFEIRGKR